MKSHPSFYYKDILNQRWRQTASPYLLDKSSHKPKVNTSRKKLLTKKQRKRLLKMERHARIENRKKQLKPQKGWVQPKYAVYIKSKEWRKRCADFYKKVGRACFACDATEKLNVHHMSYKHTGREFDEELAVLWQDWHKTYHDQNGVQADMIEKSLAFIRLRRLTL